MGQAVWLLRKPVCVCVPAVCLGAEGPCPVSVIPHGAGHHLCPRSRGPGPCLLTPGLVSALILLRAPWSLLTGPAWLLSMPTLPRASSRTGGLLLAPGLWGKQGRLGAGSGTPAQPGEGSERAPRAILPRAESSVSHGLLVLLPAQRQSRGIGRGPGCHPGTPTQPGLAPSVGTSPCWSPVLGPSSP